MARSTTPPARRPASSACGVRFAAGAGQLSSLPSVARLALPSAAVVSRGGRAPAPRRECACSPTTHPGSFRCALHRRSASSPAPGARPSAFAAAAASVLHDDARRSAMVNSFVRIAAVEGGDHVRRALAALIRPSSHHQRRRAAFRPRPSRLSSMFSAAAAADPPPSP
ncbi:hypothetical protein ABZP36_027886 [Zizania latifolia]